jgi:hypothetical protein
LQKDVARLSIAGERQMVKKPKKEDALAELLAAAPPKVLTDLILELAAEWPDVRRECFDYLKTHVVELNRGVFSQIA